MLKGESEKMQSALEALSPVIVEQMKMDFEEMFIHEVEERGQGK